MSHAALTRHGATDPIAAAVAHAVAYAEAHGNVICGLYYLESYCQQLKTGRVNGHAEPTVSRPRPGIVVVDADLGFAQPAFAAGLDHGLAAAKTCGVATLAITHSHTCTALGYFTEQIARAGFLALGATNATAIVAPPGGAQRLLGTNPMAFSVPGPEGGLALHMDFSTSATALGSVTQAKAAGRPIPEGWAVDATGAPTTDPTEALAGALLSAAGPKGWGLGLMVEVLA
ncbi:MAG: Ldh family oxidoreductase, partial [Shimia sp.]